MPNIRIAATADFNHIMEFYNKIIEDMDQLEDSQGKPGWKKGIYPNESFIHRAIESQSMWINMREGEIIAALVLNQECADGYERAKWQVKAKPAEIAVLHAFAVSTAYQKQGVAKQTLTQMIEKCRTGGLKALRLDVLKRNLPALRLYESARFVYVDTVQLFYEDTGLTDFYLYEYML